MFKVWLGYVYIVGTKQILARMNQATDLILNIFIYSYKHLTKQIFLYMYTHPLFFLIGGTLKVLEIITKLKFVSDFDLK